MVHYISFGKWHLYMCSHSNLHLYIYYTTYLARSLLVLSHLLPFVLHLRNFPNFFFDIHLYLLHSNLYLHFLLICIHSHRLRLFLFPHYNYKNNNGNNPLDFLLILMLHYLLLCQILSTLLLHFLFHLLYNHMSYSTVSHFHFYLFQLQILQIGIHYLANLYFHLLSVN